MITPAETRILHLIRQHGKAERITNPCAGAVYVWKVAGQSKSGPVDSLIRKGVLTVTADRSKAILSARGRDILKEVA